MRELVPVCKKRGARLFVDEAHGRGVVGPEGRGTAHHFCLEEQIDLIGGTFSKSMASIGGWLVGGRKAIDCIRHFASSFMFAASAAPPSVAAAMAAFNVMREEHWRIVYRVFRPKAPCCEPTTGQHMGKSISTEG